MEGFEVPRKRRNRENEVLLREMRDRYKRLVECSPYGVAVHVDGRIVYVNDAGARIVGAKNPDDLIGRPISDFCHPETFPLAKERIGELLEGRADQVDLAREKFIRVDGKVIDVEVAAARIAWRGHPAVQVIFHDVTGRILAAEALERRDRILQAVSFAAQRFLRDRSWEVQIGEVLHELGEAAGVSRVYIFENNLSASGEAMASQRYEWAARDASPQIDNMQLQDIPYVSGGFGRWVEVMKEGGIVHGNVRDFPEGERELLAAQEIRSLVAVPIFIEGEWWGFIGFDECRKERQWSTAELDAIEAVAGTFGAVLRRERVEEALFESEERFKAVFDTALDSMFVKDVGLRYIHVNRAMERLFGLTTRDLVGKTDEDLFGRDVCAEIMGDDRKVLDGKVVDREHTKPVRGEMRTFRVVKVPMKDKSGEVVGLYGMARDITDRKRAEDRQGLVARILSILNRSREREEMICSTLDIVQEFTGCDAVGVRLKEGDDYPYFETRGFSRTFVLAERSLCGNGGDRDRVSEGNGNRQLACLCGAVISGNVDPSLPFFTENGSFWTNSTTDFLSRFSSKDLHVPLRGRCNREGYESLALVPLRADQGIIGLLQLDDRRAGRFTPGEIEFFETIGSFLGIALQRMYAEEDLRESKEFVEMVYDNVSDSISVIDTRDHRIIGANQPSREAWGADGEVVGRTCYEVTHGRESPCNSPGCVCPLNETLETGEAARSMHIHTGRKDGRKRYYEVATHPLRNEKGEIDRVIHSAREVTAEKMAEEAQSVLLKIAEATNTSESIEDLLSVAHRQLGRLIDTRNFYVALYDKDTDLYTFPYCVDDYDDVTEITPQQMRNSLTDYVRRTGESLMVDPEEHRRLMERGEVELVGAEAALWLGAPLKMGHETIGVIAVQSYDNPYLYTREDLDLLAFVSDHVATAIERKRSEEALQESEEQFRDLFESSSDLIQSVDSEGRILYVNPAWLETLGYHSKELASISIFDIIHPDSREHCLDVFRRVMAGESVCRVETDLVASDGRIITVEGSVSCRMEGGMPVATRGIFRDITERKRVERMKDEFISTVSHELRTPLTSIHGALDMIHRGMAGNLSEPVEKLVEVATRNTRRLRNLIDDLLDMRKIESGKMVYRMKPLELAPLLELSMENNKSFGEQFQVGFVMDDLVPDVKVKADGNRLKQVMDNLLSNAAKFSPANDRVEVSMERRDEYVRVKVRDHGPGIPMEFRDRIFQKFTQADSSMTRRRGGTGLGLSIVKSIIESHGGKIGFETEPERGTTFYFELPEWKGDGKA
jgi:PAS domain S-box-containing protein